MKAFIWFLNKLLILAVLAALIFVLYDGEGEILGEPRSEVVGLLALAFLVTLFLYPQGND